MSSSDRITIERRVRPLRFGFVVDPEDQAAVRRAFEINTILWGGRFNALIPLFRQPPKRWPPREKKTTVGALSPVSAANGYLAAFEPDYVVEVGECWHDELSVPVHFRMKESDLPISYRDNEDALGLTVNSLYAEEYSKWQQFMQKEPIRAATVTFHGYDLLSAATFGAFPERHRRTYEHYERTFSAQPLQVRRSEFWKLLRNPPLTPLRAGALDLAVRQYERFTLYFCNPTSTLDAIDLWNFRALGWPIVPLPQEWADSSECDALIDSHGDDRDTFLILKSFSSSTRRWNRFVSRLRERPRKKLLTTKILPPVWRPRQQRDDGTWRLDYQSSEDEIEPTVTGGSIRLPVASPPFAPDDRWAARHHWANEIEMRSLWDDERSTKFPRLKNISYVLPQLGPPDISQLSSGAIAVRVEHRREQKFWILPTHERVFEEWMNDRGWTMQLSSAGRVAQQMVRSLGGLRMTWWVGHSELIRFFNSLAHTNLETPAEELDDTEEPRRVRVGSVKFKAVIDILSRVAERRRHDGATTDAKRLREQAEAHLKFLLDSSVLRVGLRIQCPHCSQRNWFSLPDVADVVRCDRCLQSFSFPVARPLDASWEYRPIGPFAVENYAQGSYTALLALRFLTFHDHFDAVWVPAFELKATGITAEYDFGVFLREHIGSEALALTVGECKSGERRFVAKDFRSCQQFSEVFPGSTFLFVTTRKELDVTERRRIATLARRGWKVIDGRWATPVAVLTSHELESEWGPSECWKASTSVAEEYRSDHFSTDMERLARATQRLYLGLDPPVATSR